MLRQKAVADILRFSTPTYQRRRNPLAVAVDGAPAPRAVRVDGGAAYVAVAAAYLPIHRPAKSTASQPHQRHLLEELHPQRIHRRSYCPLCSHHHSCRRRLHLR
jgi:hypothetical protein